MIEEIKKKSPLLIITGFRRVGKTSLLKTVLGQYSKYNIIVDLRDLGNKKYITRKDIVNLFQSCIQEFLDSHSTKKDKIVSTLQTVRGITLPGGVGGIEFDWGAKNELDFRGLFKKLDNWAKENKTQIVIAIDEAQEFRKSQHVDMSSIFASIYDNCKNIILILTGSEIGVLHDFLALDDSKSPLYGRVAIEIEVNPLSKEKGIKFLKAGFKEKKIKVEKAEISIIEDVVEELGGIIGWLNKFGLNCVKSRKINKKYVLETKKEGSILARSEFNKFLDSRTAKERYEKIMSIIAKKSLSWKALRDSLQLGVGDKIYDKNFNDLLESLSKSGFVEKIEEEYSIVDPLLRFSFENE